MHKAFSLFEIIIVILVISIVMSFAVPKLFTFMENTNHSKLKSQYALIKNALSSKVNSNVLLGNQSIETLDNAIVNKENEKLFSSVLDKTILSTTSSLKELGKWRKISNTSYEFFVISSLSVNFKFKDNNFYCSSLYEICKEYE